MSGQENVGTVDERVARLEEQVQGLLEVVAVQRAMIEASALGAEVTAGAPPVGSSDRSAGVETDDEPAEPAEPAEPSDLSARTLHRRRLLFGGAAAAAAATAAVATSASPVAAADGGNMILGQANAALGETMLTYGGSGNNGFRVEGGSSLAMIEGYQTGTAPALKGTNTGAGDGVFGLSATGNAVYGESSETGVRGVSTGSGIGVVGQAGGFGLGVLGLGTGNAYGVRGQAETLGVDGLGTVGGTGVKGTAQGSGVGVSAVSIGGIAAVATGAKANLCLSPWLDRGAPTADVIAHQVGEIVTDTTGAVWLCIAAGTPGTWRKLGGPQTAGQFHVLPAPARIVDTRPGGVPTSVLPKTPLAAGSTRVYDLKVNSSGVPAGATAALITVLLVNAANGNGNMTLWANGVAKPTANTMVWGAGAGRWTATAVSALDSLARVQVNVSAQTDLVLDVVGYYR